MKLVALLPLLILFISVAAVNASVEVDANLPLGSLSFSQVATADEVTLTGATTTFTNLHYTNATYPALILGATSGATITLTKLSANYLTLNTTSTAGQMIQAGAGTRVVDSVTGASSWSGTTLASITPKVGNSLITVMWGSSGGQWSILIIAAVAAIFLALIFGRRR